jgi:hypothetical protein
MKRGRVFQALVKELTFALENATHPVLWLRRERLLTVNN